MSTSNQIEHFIAKKSKQFPILNQSFSEIIAEIKGDLLEASPYVAD